MQKIITGVLFSVSVLSSSVLQAANTYDRNEVDEGVQYTLNKGNNGDYIQNFDDQTGIYSYIPRQKGWILGDQASSAMSNDEYCANQGDFHAPTLADLTNLQTLLRENDTDAIEIAEALDVDRVGGPVSLSNWFQQSPNEYFFLYHDVYGSSYDLYLGNQYPENYKQAMYYTCVPN